MEIRGTIKSIQDKQTISEKLNKQTFVLTTDDKYPQDVQIELINDNISLINNHSVGDVVEVGINIRGREWINPEGVAKYFNSIQGWKVATYNGGIDNSQQQPAREEDFAF